MKSCLCWSQWQNSRWFLWKEVASSPTPSLAVPCVNLLSDYSDYPNISAVHAHDNCPTWKLSYGVSVLWHLIVVCPRPVREDAFGETSSVVPLSCGWCSCEQNEVVLCSCNAGIAGACLKCGGGTEEAFIKTQCSASMGFFFSPFSIIA